MDTAMAPIFGRDLYARLGVAAAPFLLDVRRAEAFNADERVIVGAARRTPESVGDWLRELPAGRPIVAYCVHGHEVSQNVARALRAAGLEATYLEGGMAQWKDARLPTRKKPRGDDGKWVTREHPKIDRIACPWLISRFINPTAEFIYVPVNEVPVVAKATGAIPYDTKDAEFGHVGDRCSFDAIVRIYDIHDAALDHLATIVRGADTSRPDLTPQGEGLLAISHGLSVNYPDDHEMLRHGLIVYDALYSWCRTQAAKRGATSNAAA
jgi:rhodanese-related sulfurtransferase